MAKKATIRTRKRGKTYSYSFDAGKNPMTGKRKAIEKGGLRPSRRRMMQVPQHTQTGNPATLGLLASV